MLAADWMTSALFALIALMIVGFVIVYIGKTIKNDAVVGVDNEYNRARERRGGQVAVAGGLLALLGGAGAIGIALLTLGLLPH